MSRTSFRVNFCLNVKKLLDRSRRHIWNLSGNNEILASLAKWLSARLRNKWLWVRISLLSLGNILGDIPIYTVVLQTATVDVNHIRQARYSVQLSVAPIYISLKKAQKGSNFVLLLYSWAKERSSSSRMIKYWMLIMKFQTDHLVFIRSMREDNFKLFDKILISLLKSFFIFDQYNYPRCLSEHIQDLLSFLITCPKLYQDFEGGHFAV